MAEPVAPVPASERIQYLDVLRGLALFGVLAVNIQVMGGTPANTGTADKIVQFFVDWLLQSKSITLFSFLFGLGFAVQMSRAKAGGGSFLSYYPRRLAVLAVFGLIHGIVLFRGDILLPYAMLGAMLLLFRNVSQKGLLYWAGGIAGSLLLLLSAYFSGAPEVGTAPQDLRVHAAPAFSQLVAENWRSRISTFDDLLFAMPLLTFFLLGLWVWRTGIIQRLDAEQPRLRRICAVCLPLGLILNLADVLLPMLRPITPFTDWFNNVLGLMFPPILSAGYAAGLAVLLHKSAWRNALSPFRALGRMALTNYLMQSVFCLLIFTGFGLYGKVGVAQELAIAVLIYTVQVLLSNWWLARFQYGPMEWLWRSACSPRTWLGFRLVLVLF